MKLRYIGIAILVAFIIALILFPHAIYDKFIWKYFIGPIIADARGKPVSYHGIEAYEGYTIISEFFYGAGLIIFVYITYLLFEKYGIKVNYKFILSSMPFIIYGSVARVLEDAGNFGEPLSYFFISPVIYIQIGILFFASIFYGLRFKNNKVFIYSLIIINVAYSILYIFLFSKYCKYDLHPLVFLLLSFTSFLIYYKFKEKNYNASLFSFGILALTSSFYLFIYASIIRNYVDYRILLSFLLSFVIAMLLYFPSKHFGVDILKNKINITLIFSHTLDALTTYFAVVDPLHFGIKYGEKHPLPDFLMKRFYGIAYPIIKILVVLGIIYAIDDLKENLKNTIKFFILFLGLSPGLRDLLRIVLGV